MLFNINVANDNSSEEITKGKREINRAQRSLHSARVERVCVNPPGACSP